MAKILVIDDDNVICTLMGMMLTGAGHDVVLFESATLAMASIDDGSAFDLVVTDILMPEMDGIDVIRALQRRGSALAILAISGGATSPSVDLLKAAINLGAQGALRKPFTRDAFLGMVSDLLAKQT
jgi:DNA-binding NtrC family response regulator